MPDLGPGGCRSIERLPWVEKSYPNLVYFKEVDTGGHFAAWEEPALFAVEMRAAFASVRGEPCEPIVATRRPAVTAPR
jgi:hypothetical protein